MVLSTSPLFFWMVMSTTHQVFWTVMREYCEEDMWLLCFSHHKCWKSLSNPDSKTSDLEGLFWHEWCGKLNNHISDLTVFILLKSTSRQLGKKIVKWVDVKIKICKMVSKTQYSPLCKLQSGKYWVLLATLPSTKIISIFQQWTLPSKNFYYNKNHPKIWIWYFVTKIVLTYCEKKLF